MNKTKRIICTCLAMIFIFSLFSPVNAYAVSESKLRNKVVSTAKGEIGYTGTSSYSKYGEWYGYQGGWCTTFVLWCFNKAGSSCSVKLYGNITPSGGNCNSMISWYSNKGQYRKRSSSYTPKAGDLVFFDWSGNGSAQHVGIVSGTSGSTVYTIEGNCSGSVKSRSYTASGSKPYNNISSIMGYAVPNYSSVSGSASSSAATKKTTKKTVSSKNTTKKQTTVKASSSTKNTTKKQTTVKASSSTKKETTAKKKETSQQIALEDLSISASTYDLKIGDTVKLNYSLEPNDASAVVGYFCDEEGIIDISSNGEITALGSGTATVVVCANNELYSQCDFTVTDAVAQVTTTVKSADDMTGNGSDSITKKSIENTLTNLGVNVNALSSNKQLFIIPITIIGATAIISVFVAITKKIKSNRKH